MTAYYLGVDAGNSKTVAAVCDDAGNVLGWGRAGVGDIYAAPGADPAIDEVVGSITVALANSQIRLDQIAHSAFRLAGVDWIDDEIFWLNVIDRKLGALKSASVKNDGFALLRFGSNSGQGVSVVAGTGPAIAARGFDGGEFNASWWIRDLLGGLGIGEAAFRAVILADIGMEQPTMLRDRLLELHKSDDVTGLLEAFTRRSEPLPRAQHSVAARAVLEVAGRGDPVAMEIIVDQARKLVNYTAATAARVGFDPNHDSIPIILGGGVLNAEDGSFRAVVRDELLIAIPHAKVYPTTAAPITGALLDALAEDGVDLTGPVRSGLTEAQYPTDLLKT
jgi:N-acetylglucosamine kinase-like BadF-type ATPase